tara:strand:+ start:333 stop:1049 length:717 start_codon:yes stop_codon:yes gene_type:complete
MVTLNTGNSDQFSDRLKLLIGKDSVNSFAQKCGVKEGSIRQYLAGSLPGIDKAAAIADATGVSLEWLVRGEGPMMRNQSSHATEGDYVYIDNHAVEASAGSGAEIDEELIISKMAFRRDWLRKRGLNPNRLSVIHARGDSMEPTIAEGDTILLETYFHQENNGNKRRLGLDPGSSLPRDGIYVIRLDNHLVVKRLQNDMQGGVFIKSDNPAYETIHIKGPALNDLIVVGRVVWVGRNL